MSAGKSSRGHKPQPGSGSRVNKIFQERNYHRPSANEPPPVMYHHNYYSSQAPHFGDHCSAGIENTECFQMRRSPYGLRDDHQSHHNHYNDNRNSPNLYFNFNEPGPIRPPIAGNILVVRNNNDNVVFNIQRESSEWHDDPYNYPKYGPNYREPGSYAYDNNFHPDLNNPRQSSSASEHHYGYRRNLENYTRGSKSRGQSARTRSSGPPQAYKERSVSRSRFNMNDDELLCSTCGELIGLQIYKCESGHNSCKNCKKHYYRCGICGDEITPKRNTILERNLAERKLPCLHHTEGCVLVIKMAEMESHIMECPFQELQCPAGCYWRGQLRELCGHFDGFHVEQRSVDVSSEIKLRNISENSQNVYLIIIGNFNFLYHVKSSADDRKTYMTVQLIGTKFSASKWIYEVHVYNKNDSRRKYVITDVCNSFVEPVNDLYKMGKCSVLYHPYASTFINNGSLTYKIFIKKIYEDNPKRDFGKKQ